MYNYSFYKNFIYNFRSVVSSKLAPLQVKEAQQMHFAFWDKTSLTKKSTCFSGFGLF